MEHQYTAATRKLVDTLSEQELLEQVLEASKPRYPEGTEHLHYLLRTPFRYRPPRRLGSRFGRPVPGQGVFYAAEHRVTALAEFAFWRRRFFQAAAGVRLPRNEERLTVFTVDYASRRCLDLTQPPLSEDRAVWTHPDDYSGTQALADSARSCGTEVIRYESVRDPEHRNNVALLSWRAFRVRRPVAQQTWHLHLGETESQCCRYDYCHVFR